MYKSIVTACIALSLTACATTTPTRTVTPTPAYKPRPITKVDTSAVDKMKALLDKYESGYVDESMIAKTDEEIADQNAAVALTKEGDAIRDKPMSELAISDTSRLRAIDHEIENMRMKYIASGRSSDHLSGYALEAAKEGAL